MKPSTLVIALLLQAASAKKPAAGREILPLENEPATKDPRRRGGDAARRARRASAKFRPGSGGRNPERELGYWDDWWHDDWWHDSWDDWWWYSGKSSKSKSSKGSCSSSDDAPGGTLRADLGAYPGYDGEYEVTGTVRVNFLGNPEPGIRFIRFFYDLEGLEADCERCGIHIHAGTSCDTPDGPLGHGWNSDKVNDMWLDEYGAVYNSDGGGRAEGDFYLTNGFGIEDNVGHAVVVHGQSGNRLGCGILY